MKQVRGHTSKGPSMCDTPRLYLCVSMAAHTPPRMGQASTVHAPQGMQLPLDARDVCLVQLCAYVGGNRSRV